MLTLDAVTKSYDGVRVLGPLEIKLTRGRTLVLIGPSGCGKSTVLRLVNGLIEPDSGTVRVFGKPLVQDTLRPARLRMGYVIQEGGLFPHLNVYDNVALMARRLNWDAARIQRRVSQLCALTRLPAELLARYPTQLSGGQRQRVSLIRALMLEPDLLLLDEPLGALDPLIRAELQQDLKNVFQQSHCGVLMVTHDLHEAVYFADEIALLNDGCIVQQGPAQTLLESPANDFVARFVRAQHLGGPR